MKTTGKTKILAMTIAVVMIISMIPMGALAVSATPAGKAINSAADFADMSADGTYYLAADIELSETYATTFIGTFDGNGRTIKTSVPVFDRVEDATIGNFTVELASGATVITLPDGVGVLNKAEQDASREGYVCGAVACTAINSTFHDIVNNAAVENNNDEKTITTAAGILGFMNDRSDATTITIKNCVNNGNITTSQKDGWRLAAGIVAGTSTGEKNLIIEIEGCENTGNLLGSKAAGMLAYVQHINSVTITNCHNKGAGTVTGSASEHAAGILAHSAGTVSYVKISNCTNEKTVTAGQVGGVVSYSGHGANSIISNCHNSGDIYHSGPKLYSGGIVARWNSGVIEYCSNSGDLYVVENCDGPEYTGGIAGWITGGELRYCYNMGGIVNSGYKHVGGISGLTKKPVYGCYNIGSISGKPNGTDKLYIAQVSSVEKVKTLNLVNNYYLEGVNDLPAYSAYYSDFDYSQTTSTPFTQNDLESGKLAFDMNVAVGKTVYYQNINEGGATNDDYPVTDPTHGYVFDEDMDKELDNGETLYSLAFFTLDGAGIRLDPVNHGIRFSTAVSMADYGVLTKAGITLDFGTIITPDEYLAAADNNFKALAEGKYLDVNSEATGIGVFREVKGEDNATYYFFCGSITGIKAANYDWDYSAIGYVTINGNTVYSANYTTRNAAYVANAALKDTAAGYTDAEKAILGGYLQ